MRRPPPLFVLGGVYFLLFASVGVYVPYAARALLSLGFAAAAVGAMFSARALMQVFAPTVWGHLADRAKSARLVAAASLAGGGVTLAAISLATSETAGLLLYVLFGLVGSASATLVDGLTLGALGDDRERYGAVRLYGAAGFGVAALTFSTLSDAGLVEARPDVVFPVGGALLVLAGGLVLLAGDVERPRSRGALALVRAARSGRVVGIGVLAVLHWGSHLAYTGFIAPLAEARGASDGAIGWALTAAIVVEILVMRAAGRVQQRLGSALAVRLAIFVGLLRWAGLALTDDVVSFVAFSALHGVSFGLFYTTAVSLVAARTPAEARQGAQGVFTSMHFGIGGAIGAQVAGLSLASGGASGAWWAMAGLSLASLVASLFVDLRAAPATPRR